MAPEVTAQLRKESAAALGRIEAGATPGTSGRSLVEGICAEIDRVVVAVAEAALKVCGEDGRRVSVVAVGGYGRGELCPRSDVDLLFLVPAGEDGGLCDAILYGLWDLGLEVGHAVRSLEDCATIAKADQSVLSALLDARPLFGPKEPVERLSAMLGELLAVDERWRSYIVDKLAEAVKRRQKFGTTVFLLEPNVKESEGGLRELHSAMWIARARWGTARPTELVALAILSASEGATLDRAYDFLLRVRVELHLLAKRRQDVLGFQLQEQVSARLGYHAVGELDLDKKNHGVERLMRAYYFHARNLRHVTKLIIERALYEDAPPSLGQQLRPGGFKLESETLTLVTPDQLERDPAALVRIFRIAQEESLPIYSYTKNLISESRIRIDHQLRRDPSVVRDFLAILEDPKGDGSILEEMHDLGILRRLIPEVSRISARWQHSNYHVYTVDAHSLFVVKCLKALHQGAHADAHRELSTLMADLPRPQVLYLAGFLHDVGKGWRRGDHSRRGARVGADVGARFEAPGLPNWTAEETEDLVWLIKEHLTLSDYSQRRDVTDPDLIAAVAKDARTVERLTMLYILTFADMKSTSPKVWTDWKARLLEELFHRVREVLLRGSAIDSVAHLELRRAQVRSELATELTERGRAISEPLLRSFSDALPVRYLVGFRPRQMVRHLDMWIDVSRYGGIALHVRHLHREDASKLTLVCPDRPGLLALLAGTLAAHRLQILSAQIFSIDLLPQGSAHALSAVASRGHDLLGAHGPTGDRAALDVLYLKDEAGGIADDPARWSALREDLRLVLLGRNGQAVVEAMLPKARPFARYTPAVKTELSITNDASREETVIDVFCQDRLGTLHRIASALFEAGLSISLAKISTQGDRVADGFYVTDATTRRKIEDPERQAAIKKAVLEAIGRAEPRSS